MLDLHSKLKSFCAGSSSSVTPDKCRFCMVKSFLFCPVTARKNWVVGYESQLPVLQGSAFRSCVPRRNVYCQSEGRAHIFSEIKSENYFSSQPQIISATLIVFCHLHEFNSHFHGCGSANSGQWDKCWPSQLLPGSADVGSKKPTSVIALLVGTNLANKWTLHFPDAFHLFFFF